MKFSLTLLAALCLAAVTLRGQDPEPRTTAGAPGGAQAASAPAEASPSPARRSWMSRMLHPFGSSKKADTPMPLKDPKLRGLALNIEVSPQTVNLSEVRQVAVKTILANVGKRAIDLEFQTDQRIEIYLKNSAEAVLTKWSDNHAIREKPAAVLINPQEHVEYNESIATRELTPDKVYIVEVFFPKYPELRARQKILTAP